MGPVVTFGVTRSAGETGLFIFAFSLAGWLFDVAEESERSADRDPDRGAEQRTVRPLVSAAAVPDGAFRCDDADCAGEGGEPAHDRDDDGPVRDPDIVGQHDREPGRKGD